MSSHELRAKFTVLLETEKQNSYPWVDESQRTRLHDLLNFRTQRHRRSAFPPFDFHLHLPGGTSTKKHKKMAETAIKQWIKTSETMHRKAGMNNGDE